MQRVVCGTCGSAWVAPDMLTEALQSSIASWVRAGQNIIATQQITTASQLTLQDALAIAAHITQEPAVCHHCSYPLTGKATDHCPYCQAVNYDW